MVTEDSSASFQTSEDFEIHPPAKKLIVSIQPVQLAILQPQIQQPVSIQHVQQQQLAILQPQNQQPVSQQPVQHQQFRSLWVSRHTVQKFRNHNHGTRCTNKLGKLMEWKPNGKLSKEYHLNTALAVGKCQNVLLAFTMLENTEIAFFINVLTKSAMIKKYKKLINDSFTTDFNKEWIHSKRNPLRTCCVECSDVVAQMVGPVFGLLRVSCK